MITGAGHHLLWQNGDKATCSKTSPQTPAGYRVLPAAATSALAADVTFSSVQAPHEQSAMAVNCQ